ncbi:transposase [Glutamicibacter sp. NPDC087831]|uniref:IS110 family transposase n=1 Tax=Glutamicibacter sp. NPDC087831 TaxID=3363998 RepID=UPI0037F17994
MITTNIEIFLGLDVGKTDHWACAVTKDGTKIWNKTLPNDEANCRSCTTANPGIRAAASQCHQDVLASASSR